MLLPKILVAEDENFLALNLRKRLKKLTDHFSYTELHIAIKMAIYKHQINKKLQEEIQKMLAIINSMQNAVDVTYHRLHHFLTEAL